MTKSAPEYNNDLIDEKIELMANSLEEILVELDQLQPSNIAKAIQRYVLLRDKLSIVRKAYETFEKNVKGRQEVINVMLVEKGHDDGVDSFSSPYGTAFKKIKKSYRVQDWEAYSEWLIANDAMHCVEKRAAKTAVEEIHNETGLVPPGLEFIQEIEYQFRRG